MGLNATTSHDQTRYFLSLPSNKLGLWMALEAERFRAPVLRDLYPEKRVIEEERRLRVDNSPLGRWARAGRGAVLGRLAASNSNMCLGCNRQSIAEPCLHTYPPAAATAAARCQCSQPACKKDAHAS